MYLAPLVVRFLKYVKYIVTLNENCYEKILSKIDVKQKVTFGSKSSICYNFLVLKCCKTLDHLDQFLDTNHKIKTCFCVVEGIVAERRAPIAKPSWLWPLVIS